MTLSLPELTMDGVLRLLTLIDKFTRQCLAIIVARQLNSWNVIETLVDAMLIHGVLRHVHSDNGPEVTAKVVRDWLPKVDTQTLYIELGSPWENGYNKSFNGKRRDECLNGEIFISLKGAQIVTGRLGPLFKGENITTRSDRTARSAADLLHHERIHPKQH